MAKLLNRRTLLRGAGGVALSLPFLDAMRGKRASADLEDGLVDGRIKRFVVVFKGNGVHQPSFFPTSDSFTDTTLAPLERFRDRALIMDGVKIQSAIDSVGEMHQTGMGSVLSGVQLQNTGEFLGGGGATSGWGDGITIDQVIAGRIRGGTRFGSLELGVHTDEIGSEIRSRINYRGPADPLSPVDNPREIFDRLFAGFDAGAAEREAHRARRQRVVDAVQDQFSRVQRRVGVADRQRLERHLSFIDELETRLGSTQMVCDAGTRPDELGSSHDAVPAVSRAQIELLVSAFACDLTRVVTLQYSTGAYYIQHPWLGDTNTGHTLGHASARLNEPAVIAGDPEKTEATRQWNERTRWYMGEIAHLLGRLEETPDGDGNLLDSTAVLFISENSNPHHYLTRMPFVLFGDASGSFQSGIRRYGDDSGFNNNVNHNRMLIALQQAYGIDSDVFGDPQYCEGGALGDVLT